jgi:membrane associated rhomboid family serine protease
MAGAKICGECGALNGADAERCVRCGKSFPGFVRGSVLAAFEAALGTETPITRLFVGLCLGGYAMALLGAGEFEIFGGLPKSEVLRLGGTTAELALKEPWRLLSPMFVHFGVLHLGLNMMTLVDLGNLLERLLRPARFATLLCLTVISGFALSTWYYGVLAPAPVVTGGISGGLFGLVATLIGYLYARKDPAWKGMMIRLVLYSLLFAFAFPVNNAAHLGGLLLGLPMGYFFYKERRPWRLDRVFQVAAVVLVIGSIASVFACIASDAWREERVREIQKQGLEAVIE